MMKTTHKQKLLSFDELMAGWYRIDDAHPEQPTMHAVLFYLDSNKEEYRFGIYAKEPVISFIYHTLKAYSDRVNRYVIKPRPRKAVLQRIRESEQAILKELQEKCPNYPQRDYAMIVQKEWRP